MAQELGSPGIIVDPEYYNNYLNYEVGYLANQVGRPVEEVKTRLQSLGGELMAVAEQEYPHAVIWFLFTGMASEESPRSGSKELPAPAYLVWGLLEKAKNLQSEIKIVDGGERWGYCYESLADLEGKETARQERFAGLLKTFPQLRVGGTIAPWADRRQKRGWTWRGPCGKSQMTDLRDFQPLIRFLLAAYDYVWIYASEDTGYDPFDEKIAPSYNKAIKESLGIK